MRPRVCRREPRALVCTLSRAVCLSGWGLAPPVDPPGSAPASRAPCPRGCLPWLLSIGLYFGVRDERSEIVELDEAHAREDQKARRAELAVARGRPPPSSVCGGDAAAGWGVAQLRAHRGPALPGRRSWARGGGRPGRVNEKRAPQGLALGALLAASGRLRVGAVTERVQTRWARAAEVGAGFGPGCCEVRVLCGLAVAGLHIPSPQIEDRFRLRERVTSQHNGSSVFIASVTKGTGRVSSRTRAWMRPGRAGIRFHS